jgi:predicted TIM-barrel fold metal-dependent hydrolase
MNKVGISSTIMVGSPDATFLNNPTGKFNRYLENNEEILKIAQRFPEHIFAFPTINSNDDNNLELLQDYLARGATGLKLYSGHYSSFYDELGPLNHSKMDPVFAFCEKEKIPIIWHVKLEIEQLASEFIDVMNKYPGLIITIPHFMLLSTDLYQTNGQGKLRYYLENYPNLYTDISFGGFVEDGFSRLSEHIEVYRDFIIEFQDRFTFGTDLVCTDHPLKSTRWIVNLTQGYKEILEEEYLNISVKNEIEGDFNGELPGTHNGLNLPKNVLAKIYYDNSVKFLYGKNFTASIDEVIKNSKFTIK